MELTSDTPVVAGSGTSATAAAVTAAAAATNTASTVRAAALAVSRAAPAAERPSLGFALAGLESVARYAI